MGTQQHDQKYNKIQQYNLTTPHSLVESLNFERAVLVLFMNKVKNTASQFDKLDLGLGY